MNQVHLIIAVRMIFCTFIQISIKILKHRLQACFLKDPNFVTNCFLTLTGDVTWDY